MHTPVAFYNTLLINNLLIKLHGTDSFLAHTEQCEHLTNVTRMHCLEPMEKKKAVLPCTHSFTLSLTRVFKHAQAINPSFSRPEYKIVH